METQKQVKKTEPPFTVTVQNNKQELVHNGTTHIALSTTTTTTSYTINKADTYSTSRYEKQERNIL